MSIEKVLQPGRARLRYTHNEEYAFMKYSINTIMDLFVVKCDQFFLLIRVREKILIVFEFFLFLPYHFNITLLQAVLVLRQSAFCFLPVSDCEIVRYQIENRIRIFTILL